VTWLSEDPWPLGVTFGIVAAACLIALKVTQQGKYLIAAGIALLLAVGVVLIERAWVTEEERVETVIRELGRAVARMDADAALALMTPDVTLAQPGVTLGGRQARAIRRVMPGLDEDVANPARAVIAAAIRNARFDFLSIPRLKAHAGRQSGMGRAEFRVVASGSIEEGGTRFNFATDASGTDWTAGLRRDPDGRWLIESITAVRIPRGWRIPGVGP
jgi:ketosteroid isomerase-like protein